MIQFLLMFVAVLVFWPVKLMCMICASGMKYFVDYCGIIDEYCDYKVLCFLRVLVPICYIVNFVVIYCALIVPSWAY